MHAISTVSLCRYNIPILVEEVGELREKLLLVRSDSERRALEEDITGKILLACWCGVCLEIEQVLEKVVDRFVDKTLTEEERTVRAMALVNIGNTFLDVHEETHDGSLDPLLRMMRDAAAGVPKHLLLSTSIGPGQSHNPTTQSATRSRASHDSTV